MVFFSFLLCYISFFSLSLSLFLAPIPLFVSLSKSHGSDLVGVFSDSYPHLYIIAHEKTGDGDSLLMTHAAARFTLFVFLR